MIKLHISNMSRKHPWSHAMGNIILIFIAVSEIRDHCQNLLDDPRKIYEKGGRALSPFLAPFRRQNMKVTVQQFLLDVLLVK